MHACMHACTQAHASENNCMHHPQYEMFGGKYAGTNMATLSILDIGPVIFGTTVNYLQHRQLLADSLTCGNCAIPMNL
jgi:hypothetical protein